LKLIFTQGHYKKVNFYTAICENIRFAAILIALLADFFQIYPCVTPCMTRSEDSLNPSDSQNQVFQQQVKKLHHLTVYSRWLFIGFLWLIIAPICIRELWDEFAIWRQYFTWTAVRYTIVYHRLASIGLVLCIAWTVNGVIWQIRNRLWGISGEERRSLERRVQKIRQKGKRHLLWKWVCKP
jgi:hypothetical protein